MMRKVNLHVVFWMLILILACSFPAEAKLAPDSTIRAELNALFANPPHVQGYPYQEHMEQAARRYNLPLPYVLAVARGESFFKPDAVSVKGALGIMQVMPATAADYGVTALDLRDPAKNIDMGVRYLAEQYQRFGDPYLALAAYYCGPGGVNKDAFTVRRDGDEYVRYIHSHLKKILARATPGVTHAEPVVQAVAADTQNHFTLTTFDNFLDAQSFMSFMNTRMPGLQLDIFRTEAVLADHVRFQYQIIAPFRSEGEKKTLCNSILERTGFSFCL